MKRVIQWLLFLFFAGWMGFPAAVAEENNLPALNAGIDQLAFQLTSQIATRYFDSDKRPVIRVAVFDFTDPEGNITAGSRYVSTRIRLAFAQGLQFELLTTGDFEKQGLVVTAKGFAESRDLKEQMLDQLKADAYIFGTVAVEGDSDAVCDINIWGIAPPFDQWYRIKPIKFENPSPWKLGFSPSGIQFFDRVTLMGVEGLAKNIGRENLGKVIFLSQPICDDLNLSWQVRADGLIYDVRKKSNVGSLLSRTGQVLHNRVKSAEILKELSFIIKDFALVIKDNEGNISKLEPYVVSQGSDYFFLPFSDDETGLRFKYLWGKRGMSKAPSTLGSDKGWKLHEAMENYESTLMVGTHIATATLSPVAESQYGKKEPRSEYVARFKFRVDPGLNVYVINYVYRRGKPEIFVRRLEIEGSRNVPIRSIKKITEDYRVYGSY